jgi:multisubunit Na+/H+ antiporter MnhC subunit
MKAKIPPIQLPIMAAVLITLLAGLWAGLIRVGWQWPALQPLLPSLHGPLMISGFLGTLISLERAVAIKRPFTYIGPVLSGLGAIWLVVGLPLPVGQWLLFLGSVGLTAVFIYIIRQHPASYTVTMGLGAICWLVGNALWLSGWPIFRIVYWWAGFLVLTIVGERLELSRVARLSTNTIRLFSGAVTIFMVGLFAVLIWGNLGTQIIGLGLIALAVWLGLFDIARRTVRRTGLTRYIAVNLLLGYVWLLIAGVTALLIGQAIAGPRYDFMLHALFVGFVFGMIFAHAPIILPSILPIQVRFHPILYGPTIFLHLALLLRAIGDMGGWQPVRAWGGLLNAVAILWFLGQMVYLAATARQPQK